MAVSVRGATLVGLRKLSRCERALWCTRASRAVGEVVTHRIEAPNYVREAFHKELKAYDRGSDVFRSLDRHLLRFEPSVRDLTACLYGLWRCKSRGSQIDGTELLRLLTSMEQCLVQECGRHGYTFQLDLAHIAHSLAKFARVQPPLPAEVLARIPRVFERVEVAARLCLMEGFSPTQASMLLWGFAKVSAGTESLYQDVGRFAHLKLHQLGPRHIASFLWCFATVKVTHDALPHIADRAAGYGQGRLEEFSEMDVCHILYSCATLRIKNSQLFRGAAAMLEARMYECTVRGITTAMWSYASMREIASFDHAAFDYIQSTRKWDEFEPRNCAMILWSLASLRHDEKTEVFYLSLADRCIMPRVGLFQDQCVSNCLWAFATSRVQHSAMSSALVERGIDIIGSFSTQAIANVAWACVRMSSELPIADHFLDVALAEASTRPLQTWATQALATLCWSLTEARKSPAPLLGAVVSQLRTRGDEFSDVDLATISFSFRADIGWAADTMDLRREALALIAGEAASRWLPRTTETLEAIAANTQR